MKRVGVVFTSMSGNTEEIASILEEYLTDLGLNVTKRNLMNETFQIDDISKFDGLLLGTYTYGDGDIPFEMELFYSELESINLSEKVVGVFGSGDQGYSNFCGAVDEIAEGLSSMAAIVIDPIIKVDLEPNKESILQCRELAKKLYNTI